MESLVVTLETAKKLKAAGFPLAVVYAWYEDDEYGPQLRRSGLLHVPLIAVAPTAQEIADQLPPFLDVPEFKHKALLTIKTGGPGVWGAAYFVAGEFSDTYCAVGQPILAEALALLWLKLQEAK